MCTPPGLSELKKPGMNRVNKSLVYAMLFLQQKLNQDLKVSPFKKLPGFCISNLLR